MQKYSNIINDDEFLERLYWLQSRIITNYIKAGYLGNADAILRTGQMGLLKQSCWINEEKVIFSLRSSMRLLTKIIFVINNW